MRLYSIIFEETEKKTKKFTSYSAPDFALFDVGDAAGFGDDLLVLMHVPSMTKALTEESGNYKELACAAMIETRESDDNSCLFARQVGRVASNPQWKGSGSAIYALASKYYDTALTSDRKGSTVDVAKRKWAQIDGDPQWKKIGGGLDNYAQTAQEKVYYKFTGTYPDIEAEKLPGPQTEIEIDDCQLPTRFGLAKKPEQMVKMLGTANAYKYSGPLDPTSLVAEGNRIKQDPTVEGDIDQFVTTAGIDLFEKRYKT